MTAIDIAALEAALDALPARWSGPGGAVAVLLDGRAVARRAWGFSNLAAGARLTEATRFPLCSLTKQFTCMALLAAAGEPARLDAGVAALLPAFAGERPTVRQLCDNQSGLRDSWALTVLHGATPEQVFSRDDALPLMARMKTGHFRPGHSYSYSNGNFRLVAELVERHAGQPIEALYRERVWTPAGMATAALTPDTRFPADGLVGYEGAPATGYRPAENGVYWVGDAGISGSLDDMVAYEAWIDRTRDDDASPYRRIAVAPTFADGSAARYGLGLARATIAGQAFTGHGGALRGFRVHRLNSRAARLSVVVLFNHEADAGAAARELARAALGEAATPSRPVGPEWSGQWFAPATGLVARIATAWDGAVLHYDTSPEVLRPTPNGTLASAGTVVARRGDGLAMRRAGENATLDLVPLAAVDRCDGTALAGRYGAHEVEAGLEIEARGGALYARFDGFLGTGPWQPMLPAGADTFTIPVRRSMDAPAPGEWTARLGPNGLTLGCNLARGIAYRRA